MFNYVFTNVFWKFSPRGRVLNCENLVLAWRCNLEFPDFALPLERGKWSSSVESEHLVFLCTVLQSARAEDWAFERSHVSQARAGVERRFHPSSTFTVRSSGEVDARACTFVARPLERGNLRSSGTLFFLKILKML